MIVQQRFRGAAQFRPEATVLGGPIVAERFHPRRAGTTYTEEPAPYMLPDENGQLDVLSVCERHYSKQSKQDLWAGIPSPCTNTRCKGRTS